MTNPARPAATPAAFPTFGAQRAADDDALTLVGLSVAYRVRGREHDVLTDISLRIRRGEAYGLVGESGCGKSTVALAALRYLPRAGRVKAGRIAVAGVDVLGLDADALRTLRARSVSMVYQDPSSALNPSLTIARQVSEAFEVAGASASEASARAREALARVRIADVERVMASYAHQLSGGMQQRVVIAMALAANPALLILDEPTTGLDATVEAEVLDLIAQLRAELGMAVLMISHNLAIIGQMCERVGVLYAGRLVEEGSTQDVFARPRHPYTVGLLRCLPTPGRNKAAGPLDTIAGQLPEPGTHTRGCVYAPRCRLADERCRRDAPPPSRVAAAHGEQMARCHYHERAAELPVAAATPSGAAASRSAPRPVVLRAQALSRTFHGTGQTTLAVDAVSLELRAGETLGLVGESGSGKTTLARMLTGLVAPDAGGRVELDGELLPARVARRNARQLKALRLVFQNPDASLNRAHPVRRLLARALAYAGEENASRERIAALLDAVRVPMRYLDALTRQLSGGLKQRVAIAQAFAGEPRVVVCDEPTSALDVSVQAAVLNLLADLQRARGVSYVFISHDLNVVRYLSDRIAVLYAGRLVETGPAEAVFNGPHHPYTESLLASLPALDGTPRERSPAAASGHVAGGTTGRGCPYAGQCARKLGAICDDEAPPFDDLGDAHPIRCHIPADELRVLQRGRLEP